MLVRKRRTSGRSRDPVIKAVACALKAIKFFHKAPFQHWFLNMVKALESFGREKW